MNLLVVIVNYRTAGLTIDCLKSLAPEVEAAPGTKVVVTDNASGDGSGEAIAQAIEELGFTSWCRLDPLPENGGFAYGNNGAIRPFLERGELPPLVWLLNPDTIVRPGALGELLSFAEEHPEAAIIGGRIEEPDGSLARSAFRFPTPVSQFEAAMCFGPVSRLLERFVVAPEMPMKATAVDWVSGASMLIRREVFEKVGLLDEGFFMYFEETDFCFRADRAGFQRWYFPGGTIVHFEGQSSGLSPQLRAVKRRPRYWFESRARFFRKTYGWLGAQAANLFFLIFYPVGQLLLRLRGKRRGDPPRFWWDFLRYNYLK